ncbi:uncharacterized protein LOC135848537 [Planococcus citri]|uniref:uncharacterized protein LOC135848537 n=1 Tax=Planococcus citri TaxID=170843 RepID=UPI0031F753A9
MERHMATFLFSCVIIALVFQHTVANGFTTGINAEFQALLDLGITDSVVNWEKAFGRLAERYMQRGIALKELSVLNYIRIHMESLTLHLDPVHYTLKADIDTESLTTINRDDIPDEDVPLHLRGSLKVDFKTAYIKWYRIIANSKYPRIVEFVAAIKKELSDDKISLTDQDIAKSLAVIWCTVCNEINSVLSSANGRLIRWKNADEVADTYSTFQDDGFYVDFIRILFKVTKFGDHAKADVKKVVTE